MDEKITNEDLKYRLKVEGEGYALKHYYGRDIQCEDKKSEILWKKAYDSLINLENYLNESIEEDLKC